MNEGRRKVSDKVASLKVRGKKLPEEKMRIGVPEAHSLGMEDSHDSAKGNDGSKAPHAQMATEHKGPDRTEA